MEREILRNHCLWQKSWTGPPPPEPVSLNLTISQISTVRASSTATGKNQPKQVFSDSRLSYPQLQRRWHSVPSRLGQSTTEDSSDISLSSLEKLNERRTQRISRCKPWKENVMFKKHRKNYITEFYYKETLPVDATDAKRRTRRYVTNSKYGDIYEVRYDVRKEKKEKPEPSRWLWERDFSIWSSSKSDDYKTGVHSSSIDRTSPIKFKTSLSLTEKGRSQISRKSKERLSPKRSDDVRPNAQIYAHYHSHRLQKKKRQDAATLIQAVYRGWYVRHFINTLKRKVRTEHLSTWEKFVNEYKQLIKRVQERYGIRKPFCGIDLKEINAFLEDKRKYERAFRKLAFGDRLLKEDLPNFFQECNLHPTPGEIWRAFDRVFKGGNNTGELIFLLDCSTSILPLSFHYLTQFVKSVVSTLTVGPDNVRVGVVPYGDDVYQTFGINKYNMACQINEAIDNIKHSEGLTRTDLALKEMKKMFMCARPGVQKFGIVITDGKSFSKERTIQAARYAKEDNVRIIVIGVGHNCDLDELRNIASSERDMFGVYDYSSINKLRDVIVRKTSCLESKKETNLGDNCRPLNRREIMEILWTLYPPAASKLHDVRTSRWIRPLSKGTEAWTMFDEKVEESTSINTCLRLVIQSKIEKEGFIMLPSSAREGVEKVQDPDLALEIVNKWMEQHHGQDLHI